MSELLKCYAPHGVFLRENYYVQCFNRIPSRLLLELPFEENKENVEKVKQEIDAAGFAAETVFKIWRTSEEKDAENAEDYPFGYYEKSEANELCIWFAIQHEVLFIEFHYNNSNTALESLILDFCRSTRNKFGKKKSPTLKLLSKSGDQFYTEEIKINTFEQDIDKLYNDDFLEIHSIINESIDVDRSGLILLHGPPGTGKTSYIKNLLSSHSDRDFIFIPNNFVNELLQPDFISFLISNKNSILVIEDAEKVITSRETINTHSVVSTILQLTDGLFSDFLNIKIICTFNTSIDRIDKALLRKGRMIAFYEFKALCVEKANELKRSLGFEEGQKEMTLAEIFYEKDKGFEDGRPLVSIGFNN